MPLASASPLRRHPQLYWGARQPVTRSQTRAALLQGPGVLASPHDLATGVYLTSPQSQNRNVQNSPNPFIVPAVIPPAITTYLQYTTPLTDVDSDDQWTSPPTSPSPQNPRALRRHGAMTLIIPGPVANTAASLGRGAADTTPAKPITDDIQMNEFHAHPNGMSQSVDRRLYWLQADELLTFQKFKRRILFCMG